MAGASALPLGSGVSGIAAGTPDYPGLRDPFGQHVGDPAYGYQPGSSQAALDHTTTAGSLAQAGGYFSPAAVLAGGGLSAGAAEASVLGLGLGGLAKSALKGVGKSTLKDVGKSAAKDAGKVGAVAGLAGLVADSSKMTDAFIRIIEVVVGIALLLLGIRAMTGGSGDPVAAVRRIARRGRG